MQAKAAAEVPSATSNSPLELGWKSKPELNILPNMVSGCEVKREGDTTKRVLSTTRVIFSSSFRAQAEDAKKEGHYNDNCW